MDDEKGITKQGIDDGTLVACLCQETTYELGGNGDYQERCEQEQISHWLMTVPVEMKEKTKKIGFMIKER